MSLEMLLLLGSPLAGGAVLALVGHRRYAPELNVAFSAFTLACRRRAGRRASSRTGRSPT